MAPAAVLAPKGAISVVNNHGFAVYFPNGDFFAPRDAARDVVVSDDCRAVAVVSRNFENFTDEMRSALDILIVGEKLESHIHLPGLWLSPNFNKANNKLVVRKTLEEGRYQIVVFDIPSQKFKVILETTKKVFNVDWLGDNLILEVIESGVHEYFALAPDGGALIETENVDSTFFRYQPAITTQSCTKQEKE
jgi:hypothetical protein